MKNKKPLTYIAVPYSHADPKVSGERFKKVNILAGRLMSEGVTVFSPISHTHPIALEVDLPTSWDYWEKIDRDFLLVSQLLIVFCLPSWGESKGVQAEIKIAEEMGIPIIYTNEDESLKGSVLTLIEKLKIRRENDN